jgi:hypothetical protein
MKAYWGVKVQLHAFFDLGTRWRCVVSFTPLPLYPRERIPGVHWIGGWVDPRDGLDAVVKRKIPSHRILFEFGKYMVCTLDGSPAPIKRINRQRSLPSHHSPCNRHSNLLILIHDK